MTVDYAVIADEVDAKGYIDFETAWAAMSAETVPGYRDITGGELSIWAAQNPADYTSLKGAAASDVTAEMAAMLVVNQNSKLSMTDPVIRAMVDGMLDAGVFSQNGRDALFSKAAIANPKWPGIGPGHVKKAMEKRARGDI